MGRSIASALAGTIVGAWFQRQAPSYQRSAIHWVVSAKREQTRAARLATLINDCANGRRIRA